MTLKNKIPPPIVTLVFAAMMWFISIYMPAVAIPSIVRISIAICIALVGIIVCVLGVVEFRRAKTTVNPLRPETASSLVGAGIYQHTRNPMYLGFLLFLLAWAIYLFSPMTLLGLAGFVLYMNHFQIQPEEHALQRIFGKPYETYKSKVRRWL
jgi:protein-S-isoprenylcysteine O-methyltransferase Ste14